MLFDLQQVRRYLTDPVVRPVVQDRVAAGVDEDTRVVVGVIRWDRWWPMRRCVPTRDGRCGAW
jgi:hypothetical protein